MNIFQHIGHWLHIGEKDIIGDTITTIHRGIEVVDELKIQMPTLAEDTATVASDVIQCKALAAAVALVVAGGGVNIAADAGVLGALVTDGPALIKLFNDAAVLIKTTGGDIAQDAAILGGKTSNTKAI